MSLIFCLCSAVVVMPAAAPPLTFEMAIERLGGYVTRDENRADRPIVEVYLDHEATAADLSAAAVLLPRLPPFRDLHLYGKRITNASIKRFSGLRSLRSLTPNDDHMTDEGFKHLAHLRGLEELTLYGNLATGTGLAALAPLEKLRHLHLGHVTRPGLKAVATLQQLESVSLHYPGDEAGALAELAALKNLKSLYIYTPGNHHYAGLSALKQIQSFRTGSKWFTDRDRMRSRGWRTFASSTSTTAR